MCPLKRADSAVSRPLFCFRFDVDTPRCIAAGVPNLLVLAREKGVRFTFFMNMGRAVAYRNLLRRGRRGGAGAVTKLTSVQKLGLADTLKTGLLNPLVGAAHRRVIRNVIGAGHEVGLHGGKNHATWQYGAHAWPTGRIEEEIAWGKNALEDISGNPVRAFSSPGWNGGPVVNGVLSRLGFRYSADLHGEDRGTIQTCAASRLAQISTDISGEPGGVGFLEWLAASGMDTQDSLGYLDARLGQRRFASILYDHPCYAGIRKLELLAALIDRVRQRGYEITTMNDILSRHGR
jgi:peptidoglycan/xylan/chitin deacetylase (PgdA/CDA1 family)